MSYTGLANDGDLQVLDNLLGSGSPTNVWVGLSSTLPTKAGANITEGANDYTRKQVTNNSTNFPGAALVPAESGIATKTNGVAVTLAQAVADWFPEGGKATHWFVVTAANYPTSGKLLAFAALDTPRAILAGDTASFAIGTLKLTGKAGS